MILKVLQADTGKWFYYDKIKLFKFKLGLRDIGEPIGIEQIILTSENRNFEDQIAICDLVFEDGHCLEVFFDLEGYLLNDTGKTIERII